MTTIKTIETVECATDAKCCICGKNIIAYELHNELKGENMSNQEQTPGYKYAEDNTLCFPTDGGYQTSKDKLNMKAGGIK